MKLTINDIEYEVPFDPAIISLGEYIEYHEQYGLKLDEKLISILEDEEINENDKLVKLDNLVDEEAISWFSFWTKVDLFKARNLPDIAPILNMYRVFRYMLKSSEEDCILPFSTIWNNEQWEIQDFKINPASKMSLNEVITSKELIQQIEKLGLGRFKMLLYLSVIFFRKSGELFSDEMIHEDSERLNLMRTLPLSYALHVSFFLNACVSFWRRHLVSSENLEAVA